MTPGSRWKFDPTPLIRLRRASELKSGELRRLGADLHDGKISRSDYEQRILEMG